MTDFTKPYDERASEVLRILELAEKELYHARFLLQSGPDTSDGWNDVAEALEKVAQRYRDVAIILDDNDE